MPISLVGEADTVDDLLRALEQAGPSGRDDCRRAVAPRPCRLFVPPPSDARLVEVLEWHVAQHPDRLHLTVLEDDATVVGTLTYGELAAGRDVAGGLISRDVVPGDRVALMLPTGVDFFIAFFGILYAGAIPVPIYPPMHRRRSRSIYAGRPAFCEIPVPAF